ncbi:autophagy-related protein 8D-like [Oryza brachyantha]|uniref:Autophagy-related protein n=1 Tax=Oryza brachyantha TaxID=4533 RepID=J3KV07_ORYBR|nr:autophagy-related protein 8D-like [Oryza brachyantha]
MKPFKKEFPLGYLIDSYSFSSKSIRSNRLIDFQVKSISLCPNERAKESAAMIASYPERIPVIVERFSSSLPELEKRNYLIPCGMPIGQFIFVLRSRLHLSPGTALLVFVSNTLPQTAELMGSVYESFKDEGDGFL